MKKLSSSFSHLAVLQYLALAACMMLLNFVTEFLFQRFFVFGNSIDTNVKEKA